MIYRELDENGDYQIGRYLKDNAEAVAQAVKTRLLLFKGEWFLDTEDGTDWFGRILGEGTKRVFELEIKKRVGETQGVIDIVEFDYTITGRDLNLNMRINTIYGEATVNI